MISALLAIAFAATLTTESNGDFFTLPEWMPGEVGSHDTPGSDPDSGSGGWYVEIYTNGVDWGDWEITRGTNVVSDYGQPTFYKNPYSAGGIWSLQSPPNSEYESGTLMFSVGSLVSMIPMYIDGTEDDDELSWVATFKGYLTYEDWTNGVETTLPVIYVATREKEETPLPSGKYKPRAARLTDDVQAGVNSTFEAIYERLYYASQGQSNAWDTAEYGPKDDHKRFRFDLPSGSKIFGYVPTNRTITSRRLLDYTNVWMAAKWIKDDFFYNASKSVINRPGWVCGDGSGSSFQGRMYWSSTDDSFPDEIVPVFNEIPDPTFPIRWQWINSCATLGQLVSDYNVWRVASLEYKYPAVNMMTRLDMGYPNYAPWQCMWSRGGGYEPLPITNTLRYVIEKAYPHADGWAITNGTRRLMSDRLCCINQVLGLMDRTYLEPYLLHPPMGSNTTYETHAYCDGSKYEKAYWDYANQVYHFTTNGVVEWGDISTSNAQFSSLCAAGGAVMHRTRDSGARATIEMALQNGAILYPESQQDVIDRLMDELTRQPFSKEGDFHADIFASARLDRSGRPTSECEFEIHGEYGHTFTLPLGDSLDGEDMQLWLQFGYTRDYGYARSIGSVFLGATQPGSEAIAASKVVSSKYGVVYSSHDYNKSVGTIPLTELEYSASHSTVRYTSQRGSYSSRNTLVDVVNAVISRTYAKFVSGYGHTPTDWASIIPININDVTRTRATAAILGASIGFTRTNGGYVIDGNIHNGTQTISSFKTVLSDGSVYDGFKPCMRAQLVYHGVVSNVYHQVVSGHATDGKVGIITRTDWNWDALKRTDD